VAGGYVAGFVDGGVASAQGALWDVLLDLRAGAAAVVVADAAAADFAMTPLHKGVAKALLAALAAPDACDASVAAAVAAKSAALLDQVRALLPRGGDAAAAADRLREAALPDASARFVRALAKAEYAV
jgi:hypothetical protein